MRKRPRRNRKSPAIRHLIRENTLVPQDLIAPLFVVDKEKSKIPIPSMPGIFRLGTEELVEEVKALRASGISTVCLFPVIAEEKKSPDAIEALNPDGINQRAIRIIKDRVPDVTVMTDVALDPYSKTGHDGLVDTRTGEILNDATLDRLAKLAVIQAGAGADIIGPSDMMDGRVGFIRDALDKAKFTHVSIMAYTAKYASSFYSPFRDALDSAPRKGDKKTYQMDYANKREALLELRLDEEEGADIVMVKPGLAYLDILSEMRRSTQLPLAVYNVSGEYAMVKAAAQAGWIDEKAVCLEILYAFKRAGADMILTYFAKEAALLLGGESSRSNQG